MKKYQVEVICRDIITVEANDEDEACDKALNETKKINYRPYFDIVDEGVEEIKDE